MKKDFGSLRIRPLPPPPNKERISFRLPAPTLETFRSYLAAYASIYGVEADPDFVANEIFISFFESDKAFAAYLQTLTDDGKPAERGAAEGARV